MVECFRLQVFSNHDVAEVEAPQLKVVLRMLRTFRDREWQVRARDAALTERAPRSRARALHGAPL